MNIADGEVQSIAPCHDKKLGKNTLLKNIIFVLLFSIVHVESYSPLFIFTLFVLDFR